MTKEELEKENAELDCQMNRNKYCYSCVNATDRCFRNEIGCPCEKYKSYKDENAELKEQMKCCEKQGVFPFGKWHDLRKVYNDLPEPYTTVLDENGDKITYCGGGIWTVYSDYYEKDIVADSPKAWCEIPKFKE